MKSHNEQMFIILVDDDEDDRNFFEEAFNEIKMDSRLLLFKNGMELMDYLNTPESKLPHILFLDLNMNGKTGAECLAEIRVNSRFKEMSVAIYSTSNAERDIEDTLSGGANIYIHKPSSFVKLKEILQYVLKINWQFHTSGLNKESFFLNI